MQSRRSSSGRKEDHVRKQAAVTSAQIANQPPDLALQRDDTAGPPGRETFNYAKCPACSTGSVLHPQLRTGDRFICESCGEPLMVTGPFKADVLRTPVTTSGAIIIGITVIAALVVAWVVFSNPGSEDVAPETYQHPTVAPGSPENMAPADAARPAAAPRTGPTYVYCVPGEDVYHTRRDCSKISPTATIEAMSLREARRQGRLACETCSR